MSTVYAIKIVHIDVVAMEKLKEALEDLAGRQRFRPLEVTPILGGALGVGFEGGVDALDLCAVSRDHQTAFSVKLTTPVAVKFDPSMTWETPRGFSGNFWPGDVCASHLTGVTVSELSKSGSTRVVMFTGGGDTSVNSHLIERIMASPNVIDIRFRPGQFDVLLARETPLIGGLAHLAATHQIKRRYRMTPAAMKALRKIPSKAPASDWK